MKVKFSSPKPMTFEVWMPHIDQTTETVTWDFVKSGTGAIEPRPGGDILLVTDEALRPGQAIRNLTDIAGVNIFAVDGNPYQMFITSLMPLVGIDGRVDGYQHTLSTRLRQQTIQILSGVTL